MEFKNSQWSISKLIAAHTKGNLNLNPPYQRNFIWSTKDQNELISSIKKGYPLPSIFLYERYPGKYEVVDGQQRCRTIISFNNRQGARTTEGFLDFKLPVTVITGEVEEGEIENFYTVVNKSGLKVNNPELKKSEYFDTIFLKLNDELANSKEFSKLELFKGTSILRMNDVDFVSELTTYLVVGDVTDKKESVDRVYEKDISQSRADEIKVMFLSIIGKIDNLNEVYPVRETRFKQRNDFYTLFQFIDKNSQLSNEELLYFYEILVTISPFISPADSSCEPLKEYAVTCVTQSNSKAAREKRYQLLCSILMGDGTNPSKEQKEIKSFFKLGAKAFSKRKKYVTFDMDVLNKLDDLV